MKTLADLADLANMCPTMLIMCYTLAGYDVMGAKIVSIFLLKTANDFNLTLLVFTPAYINGLSGPSKNVGKQKFNKVLWMGWVERHIHISLKFR